MKLSFLIAAHNEGKIISKTLENLLHLPYKNYEVLIGLDGCTDNTEEIVESFTKRSKVFRYFNFNLRGGKTKVINNLIKKAKGSIIIINDADWIFKVKDKTYLNRFLSVFNNKKIGGIAENFPVEWDKKNLQNSNIGYKMVAYSTYLWFRYQRERFSRKKGELIYLKEPTMSLTNIFRKSLYKENLTLGDDIERTIYIMQKGLDVVSFDDINMPRMVAVYDNIKIRGLIRQKVRTAIARKQVNQISSSKVNINNYYLPSTFYILRKSWRFGVKIGILMVLWVMIAAYGQLIGVFSRKSTSVGWRERARE